MLVKDIIKAKYGVVETITVDAINLALYKLIPLLIEKDKKTVSIFVITEKSLNTVTNVYLPVFIYNAKSGLAYTFLPNEEYHRSQKSEGIFSRSVFKNVFTLDENGSIIIPPTSTDFVIQYIPSLGSNIFVWEDDTFKKEIGFTSTELNHSINPALASIYMYMSAFKSLYSFMETIKTDSENLTTTMTTTLANIITEFGNISDRDVSSAYDTCLSSWAEIRELINILLSKTDSSISATNTRLASDDIEVANGYTGLLSTTATIDSKKIEGYLAEVMQYTSIFNNAIQSFSSEVSKVSAKYQPIVNLLGVKVQALINKLQTLPVYQNKIQIILKDIDEEIEVLP